MKPVIVFLLFFILSVSAKHIFRFIAGFVIPFAIFMIMASIRGLIQLVTFIFYLIVGLSLAALFSYGISFVIVWILGAIFELGEITKTILMYLCVPGTFYAILVALSSYKCEDKNASGGQYENEYGRRHRYQEGNHRQNGYSSGYANRSNSNNEYDNNNSRHAYKQRAEKSSNENFHHDEFRHEQNQKEFEQNSSCNSRNNQDDCRDRGSEYERTNQDSDFGHDGEDSEEQRESRNFEYKSALELAYERLNASSSDSFDTIKKKYKKLMFRFHPDKATSDSERKEFTAISQEINKAYEIIKSAI